MAICSNAQRAIAITKSDQSYERTILSENILCMILIRVLIETKSQMQRPFICGVVCFFLAH